MGLTLARRLLPSLALALSACNYPVAEPAATATELGLEEIEALVAATLEVEAEQTRAAATATDTSTAERTASPTSAASSTPSPTPTPSPTFTPRPSNTPLPTSTSAPTSTPQPTSPPPPSDTPQPDPTPCAKFTNPSLSAKPGAGNQVSVSWNSSGGCEPIGGTITAMYEREPDPYAKYDIKVSSGSLVDRPDPICEGTFTIQYELVLVDATGVSITTRTEVQVTWVC